MEFFKRICQLFTKKKPKKIIKIISQWQKHMVQEIIFELTDPGTAITGRIDIPQKNAIINLKADLYLSLDGGLTYRYTMGVSGLHGDHVPTFRPAEPTNPYSFELGWDGRPCFVKVITQTDGELVHTVSCF